MTSRCRSAECSSGRDAAGSFAWLKFLSLPAPITWAVVLGAVGRMSIRAQQEKVQLETEVARAEIETLEAHAHLQASEAKRRTLEQEQQEVISELMLAREVQRTLVPENIQRPDVEVFLSTIPTRFVGGDYVHTCVVENRWLYLVLIDVSGHGISAALVVARLHGLIRRMTLTKKTPVGILERLNRSAMRLLEHTYFFLTCAVMRLDLENGRLRYATAGHSAQILLRQGGSLELLRTPNRLIGMDMDIFDAERPSAQVQLEPGDSVLLFTDGLFEVLKDRKEEVLGERGLQDHIAEIGPLPPALLAGEILEELADFQGDSEFDDDVTLLVAQYHGRAAIERPTRS